MNWEVQRQIWDYVFCKECLGVCNFSSVFVQLQFMLCIKLDKHLQGKYKTNKKAGNKSC